MGLTFDTDAILKEKQRLEDALSSNPRTVGVLRRLIRKVLREARERVISSIHFKNGDPRGARYSIRTSVYKQILGGNLNVYNSRKAGRRSDYERTRKLDNHPNQRGGNRCRRDAATERIDAYGPHDRGFILRFTNTGTSARTTRYGNRGSIGGGHWFPRIAGREMEKAVGQLSTLIDEEIVKILGNG